MRTPGFTGELLPFVGINITYFGKESNRQTDKTGTAFFVQAALGPAASSVDVDDLFRQLRGGHVGILIALPLEGGPAHVDGLGGAELEAAETLDTICAKDRLAAYDPDISTGA